MGFLQNKASNLQEAQKMIELTKINGVKILVNSNLIETVEETPDTVINLTKE